MRARGWLWGRGGRRALCSGGAGGVPGAVRPYEAIPCDGRNRWLNLYRVWRSDGFQHFHHRMQGSFQRLGPIYRERVGTYDCVNVLLPRDAAQLFRAEGVFPRRMGIEAWSAHRRLRNHKCGLFLLNGQAWRSDRLALNREVLSPAGARKFLPLLDAVARDFAAAMSRRVREAPGRALTLDLHPLLFRFTLEASSYALYGERLGLLGGAAAGGAQRFIGAVQTMLRTTLPLLFLPPPLLRRLHPPLWREHLHAWDTIFQHADRSIQRICRELRRGGAGGYGGLLAELLLQGRLPLDSVKANVTEFTAGGVDTTLCQVALYAMGRSPDVFSHPERYDPSRWLGKDDTSFRALAFGFGARQCIGRRLAEAEMMLFLMHVLRNFTIEAVSTKDIRTVFRFILMPEESPLLTFRTLD
ncbi:cytochrome P450 11B, mitochondrial-like [Grus japonensis]|uniref:steroid 11beta-monooxygenase n=1 Tax=Grus japonensis TaxID=30415 RepID=A0ABC9WAH7_GRUJA